LYKPTCCHWRGSKSLPISRFSWRSRFRLNAAVTPSRVVVGALQHVVRLHEVDADQQAAARRAFAHAAQEGKRFVGL
jgi:hypothetical protein